MIDEGLGFYTSILHDNIQYHSRDLFQLSSLGLNEFNRSPLSK